MENQESPENSLCWVCKKNEITFRVMPCRHAYLCKRCSMKMASGGKCKICKEFFVECKKILPGEPLNDGAETVEKEEN